MKIKMLMAGIGATVCLAAALPSLGESLIDQPDIPRDSAISRGIQQALGLNALADWIASREIKKGIRKKLEGHFRVRLNSFSALSLTNGAARKLEIEGHNLVYDKALIIQDLHLETNEQTPIWIDLKNGQLKAPIEADFEITLVARSINRSFQTPKMMRLLGDIKVPLVNMGSQHVSVTEPMVAIEAGKIMGSARVNTVGQPDEKALETSAQTGLAINPETGWLDLTDFHVWARGVENTDALSRESEQVIETMLLPVKWLPKKYKQSRIVLTSVNVLPDRVRLSAHLTLIPPPPSTQ